MKKSQKVLIGTGAGIMTLAAAAAIAGPMIYRDLIVEPAADAPTLSASRSTLEAEAETLHGTGEDLDPALLAGEWTVADDSAAGYRVDEVLNGTEVTVTGRTDQISGTFTIGDDGLTLADASLTVDVASIATDSGQRDTYFRDQAMRADEFPEATFTLSEPVTLEAAPASGDVVSATATGELELAGERQAVTFDVEVRSDGEAAEIAGSIPITFADFGIEAPDLGFVSVEDSGAVEFQLTAERT